MRIFKNAWFVRFARAQKISEHVLGLSETQLNILIVNGQVEEVASNDEKVSK